MSRNRDEPRLRYGAGKYADSVVSAIILLQIVLVVIGGLAVVAVIFFKDGFELLPLAVPTVLGVGGLAYLLNFLYETE